MKKAWGWLVFFIALLIVFQIALTVVEPLLPIILTIIVIGGLSLIAWKVHAYVGKRRRFF